MSKKQDADQQVIKVTSAEFLAVFQGGQITVADPNEKYLVNARVILKTGKNTKLPNCLVVERKGLEIVIGSPANVSK